MGADEGRHKVNEGSEGRGSGDGVFGGGRSATDDADGANGGVGAYGHLGRSYRLGEFGENLRCLRILDEER